MLRYYFLKKFLIGFVFVSFLFKSSYAENNVVIEVAGEASGKIEITLFPDLAPLHVERIKTLVNSKSYDGVVFHRVIDGFMIQGGGFDVDMSKRDTHKPIFNESKNKLSNVVGTIAMARTSDPHSATAQFYINVANNTFLNYASDAKPGYCVFGRVLEGMGVVQQIKKVETETKNRFQNVCFLHLPILHIKWARCPLPAYEYLHVPPVPCLASLFSLSLSPIQARKQR